MQCDIEEIDDSLQFELVTDAMSAYQVMIDEEKPHHVLRYNASTLAGV